jgi:hypothetical protein
MEQPSHCFRPLGKPPTARDVDKWCSSYRNIAPVAVRGPRHAAAGAATAPAASPAPPPPPLRRPAARGPSCTRSTPAGGPPA